MSNINNVQMLFYIFLLIEVIKSSSNNKIYKIPFAQYNCEHSFKSGKNISNIIEDIYYNIIYVNLTLGTPPQKVPFQLNMDSPYFYASNKYFFPYKSNTNEYISSFNDSLPNDDLKKGMLLKDYLYISNNTTKIKLIYATEFNKYNNLGNIGLSIPKNIKHEKFQFFYSLKKEGIIDSYSWTLKYYNNIKISDTLYKYGKEGKYIGEFIIGEEPHNYEENKKVYNETNFLKINARYDFNGVFWGILFNKIYMIDQNNDSIDIHGNREAELNPEIGFIMCPNEFFLMIQRNFFNKYKNICREKSINNTLFKYMECDKNETFNISNFPNIFFKSNELESIFNLTNDELFIYDETTNKYIFLIFNNRYQSFWVFGAIFLRKYQFVFNPDEKTIGYYKSMNLFKNINSDNNKEYKSIQIEENNSKKENGDSVNSKENNEETKKVYIIVGILFFIFSSLFILLGIFIQRKCLNYKRKKRVNELEDEENDFDKNNSLINNEKNIIL